MLMRCAVTGAGGFIGRRLVARLGELGHKVIALKRPYTSSQLAGADAVLHLAGENVAQRWTPEVKQRIFDSRVVGTRSLVEAIAGATTRPKVLVSASAIGFYCDRGDEVLTESSPSGTGFLADVCRGWETEADRAREPGLRVAKIRIGFVMGLGGGAMGQMLPIFRLGLGGRLGSGRQWMPWIHLDDVVEMFIRAATDDSVSGVWNAGSPNPVRNSDFTAELGKALHRPVIFPVPAFALKAAFGEFGAHMMDSVRLVPEAALKAGFQFRFPEVGAALRDLVD